MVILRRNIGSKYVNEFNVSSYSYYIQKMSSLKRDFEYPIYII